MQRKFDADGFVTSFKSLVVNRVNSGFDWKFYFWDRHITSVMSQMIASLPNFLLAENIDTFFKEINACKLCTGNDDFCDLIACKVEGIHWSNAHLDDRKLNSVKKEFLVNMLRTNYVQSIICIFLAVGLLFFS